MKFSTNHGVSKVFPKNACPPKRTISRLNQPNTSLARLTVMHASVKKNPSSESSYPYAVCHKDPVPGTKLIHCKNGSVRPSVMNIIIIITSRLHNWKYYIFSINYWRSSTYTNKSVKVWSHNSVYVILKSCSVFI